MQVTVATRRSVGIFLYIVILTCTVVLLIVTLR